MASIRIKKENRILTAVFLMLHSEEHSLLKLPLQWPPIDIKVSLIRTGYCIYEGTECLVHGGF